MKENFTVQVIKTIDEAKKWWEFFSPHECIYNEWEFRFCFYKYFNNELFFYVGFVNDKPIGLLPLQLNQDENHLEAFGGFFMRNNRVFVDKAYEGYIPHFFNQISGRAKVSKLVGEDFFTTQLPIEHYLYVLDISSFKTYNEFLETKLNSKRRSDLKRQIKLTEQEGIFEPTYNEPKDLQILIDFNKETFGVESSFYKPHRVQIFQDFLSLPFHFRLIKLSHEKKVPAAVALGLEYNNTYFFINAGVNRQRFPHINTYLTLQVMNDAIRCNTRLFDAGLDDLDWKEKWGFTKIPQYKWEQK